MLEILKEKNPKIRIFDVGSEEFKEYGRVIKDLDFTPMIEYALNHAVPGLDVTYERSIPQLEAMPLKVEIERRIFGEMRIQIGWCIGRNKRMNGMEYHKGSEVIVAATDLLLLLGRLRDVRDYTYDSSKAVAFFVPATSAVELYATTLHFAPINVHPYGFIAIIILPIMTNAPLDTVPEKTGENRLLFAKNKWLIVHETSPAAKRGAYVGIIGENVEIRTD
ncbi:MAG: DUF4867 family protein [Nitrososphaerota archaeon]|nr:DUF4867 family protein [Candidatus Bathyarchaeota archaeon]MDW8048338.1 DUF4867 family protein [Nitrososphaerota archaeon]